MSTKTDDELVDSFLASHRSDHAVSELAGVRGTPMESDKRGWIHVAQFDNVIGVQIRGEVVGLTPAEARRLVDQLSHIINRTEARIKANSE